MPAEIVLHLRAKNDSNGNPRRFYAVINAETGQLIEAIDEGYRGFNAWKRKYPNAIEGPSFDTTPECRRDYLR